MTMHDEPRIALIVDDLEDMRTVLRMTLRRSGWTILEAADGLEALELLEDHLPSLVLMDYNMPRMDGIEACQHIKANPMLAAIPVIIYTGAYADRVRDSALSAGATAFLTKPILPNELREVVESVYAEASTYGA